jgi:hypothetical protein
MAMAGNIWPQQIGVESESPPKVRAQADQKNLHETPTLAPKHDYFVGIPRWDPEVMSGSSTTASPLAYSSNVPLWNCF